MKNSRLALGLLAVGVVAQFAWRIAPDEHAGRAWNISQALLMLTLLSAVASAWWQTPVRYVCALLAGWQIMTAGCSIATITRLRTIEPGQAQCSALLDLPLGAISGLLALMLAWRLYEWSKKNG